MSQIIPIYIPTYINSADYSPARVLPRMFFYNGPIECEGYFIQDENGASQEQFSFPYFDNYNVVSGSFPTIDSLSLLFNNEETVYGETPTNNLYTTYWEKYISLLYDPKTRLLECSAIIPLADYVKMELNDVVNFRGNYYYLRAINEYSLKTGDCKLQLLGPILNDTISDDITPEPIPIPLATGSITLSEWNESPTAFLDANLFVSGTAYYFSGNYTQYVSGGAVDVEVTLEAKNGGSTVWGSYKTASANLTIRDNGVLVGDSTIYVFSGSSDNDVTLPTTFPAGHTITITATTTPITGSLPPTASFASLDWSFTETSTNGTMDIYVNGMNVESRNATSNGTYTVEVGDEIYVEIIAGGCTGGNSKANAYCSGIITDAACDDSFVDLVTTIYTVQPSDEGNTISLDCYALCDSACV